MTMDPPDTFDTDDLAPDEERPYEAIDWNKRYVLGVSEAGYGVWDKLTEEPEQPLALYPQTDEGLDHAERDFNRLSKADRAARGPWFDRYASGAGSRVLVWIVATGIVVWIAAGAVANIFYALGFRRESFDPTTTPFEGLLIVFQTIEFIAFRLWVGALAFLGALVLARWRARG